jgi:hypothetical protein
MSKAYFLTDNTERSLNFHDELLEHCKLVVYLDFNEVIDNNITLLETTNSDQLVIIELAMSYIMPVLPEHDVYDYEELIEKLVEETLRHEIQLSYEKLEIIYKSIYNLAVNNVELDVSMFVGWVANTKVAIIDTLGD